MNKKVEKISLDFIAEFLPVDPIIIEAGANIGRDSIKIAKKWPLGKIYSFEPVSELYEKLVSATLGFENIKTYKIALCDKVGKTTFNVCENVGAISSLLKPEEILEKFSNAKFIDTEIDCTTLDQWAKENKINHVDFMWLDLQGVELLVLKNSPKIMSNVKAIHIEVNLTSRYKNMTLYPEIKLWMESQGFYVAQESLHHVTWGDVLFVRSNSGMSN